MKFLYLLPLFTLTLANPLPQSGHHHHPTGDMPNPPDWSGQHQGSAPVCEQCTPFPELNKCDITTSCVSLYSSTNDPPTSSTPGNAPLYCACRAGYKADPAKYGAGSDMWRLPWASQAGRVFVRPGIVCDTLCGNALTCEEVPVRNDCM